MKYLGIALIALAAALGFSVYKRRLCARVDRLSAVLRLVEHISERVSGYLEPPSVWARGFSSGDCEIDGFLSLISSGENPRQAYSMSDGLMLSGEARVLADTLFCELGRRDIGESRHSLDSARSGLERILSEERRQLEERIRVGAAVTLLLSLGGIITVI